MKIFRKYLEKLLAKIFSEIAENRQYINCELSMYGNEIQKTYLFQLKELEYRILKMKLEFIKQLIKKPE